LVGDFVGWLVGTGVQGYSAYGFSGQMLWNAATGNPALSTVLRINGLPAHTSLDINFLFGAIDSWDSDNGTVSPDYFNVTVDGVLVFQPTFAIASGTHSYPNGLLHSGTNLGFSGWNDAAYDMGQAPELHNIAHTNSSVVIRFFSSGSGWQGGDDESWAIDNLEVRVNSVPLPGTVVLMGSGLAGLIGWRRFRNS
jgi:hypothetical protein